VFSNIIYSNKQTRGAYDSILNEKIEQRYIFQGFVFPPEKIKK
jgi:hypothetical protein